VGEDVLGIALRISADDVTTAIDPEATRHQAAHLMGGVVFPPSVRIALKAARCQSSGRMGKNRPDPVIMKSWTTERTPGAHRLVPGVEGRLVPLGRDWEGEGVAGHGPYSSSAVSLANSV
jgi:hypothetical protein